MARRQQFRRAAVITKSDATVYSPPLERLYIGGTGHVQVKTVGGDTVLFSALPVGTFLDGPFTQVQNTNTTATLIVGQWNDRTGQ